jgi:twitching motility protein PilT
MLRLQPASPPSLEGLGLPAQVSTLLDSRRGLLLVSGGPRSGKSTTMAAMVEHIARRGDAHVVVLDEQHDFSFSEAGGLVSRRLVRPRRDELTRALRSAFREDPDVIVVGDLGGPESTELCMQLASTGHLVIAGLTASGTIAALQGLEAGVTEMALPQFRSNLASELLAVIFQELIPDTRGGLVLAPEVVCATKALRRALAEGSFERIPILLSFEAEQGSVGLDECLMDLVESGTIALDEAFARARDRHRFLMTAG